MAAQRPGSAAPKWLSPSALLLLAAFLLSAPPPARALRFDLESGHTKCISDEIKVGSMTVGKYNVIGPDPNFPDAQLPESHRVFLSVTSPNGNSMHYADNVQSGHFAFTAAEVGNYIACFWAADQKPPVTVGFEFDWRSGVKAKDWPSVAKKGKVYVMELELKKLDETIKNIHEEMFYLREREEEMQDLNRKTNSRMVWLGFLSLGICLSVAGLQLWHLKTFFERKKLL